MTIKDCIDIVDNIKPNQYTIRDKVMWLSFIEKIIINDVLKTHEGYDGRYDSFEGYSEDKLSVTLIVPSPYDRLYTAYLKMKIDQENGETARYNNSMLLYNTYMQEYRKHYNKTHMPLDTIGKRDVIPPRKASVGLTDAEYENLKRDIIAELYEEVTDMMSEDKIQAVVTSYMNTNAAMLKGKDGRDGIDGKDGYTPKKNVDYFDGLRGPQGIQGERGHQGEMGPRGFQGPQGDSGIDGYTPRRGTDYWTEDDKAEVVEEATKGAAEEVEEIIVGKKNVTETTTGEIFNDYENNTAEGDLSHAEGANSKTYSKASHAEGSGTKAGCKGYWYSKISGNEITLTTTHDKNMTETWDDTINFPWVSGDIISVVAGSKYVNCATIQSINKNVLTVEWDNVTLSNTNYDDGFDGNVVYVVAKPSSGIVDLGIATHAEGYNAMAQGAYSHAECRETQSQGHYSHAEGRKTIAQGAMSHAEGQGTLASGERAHAEGYNAIAQGMASHAEGYFAEAPGNYSHAEGNKTFSIGGCSHTEGIGSIANGSASHAEGSSTATGEFSHSEGGGTIALGNRSHAEGNNAQANANYSHAEGNGAVADGVSSHAEGVQTSAKGVSSHAEGAVTHANGQNSHAEGYGTYAEKDCSHSEGYGTRARADYSHAEGNYTAVNGVNSHAEGYYTIATGKEQHVQGRCNIEDTENKYAHIVGNGDSPNPDDRSNAHTLDWDGNAWFAGFVEASGIILRSSIEDSTKKFLLTIDDAGTIKAEVIEK